MTVAPVPANEKARLKALDELNILDTDPEVEYDELVQLAAYICEIEAAHISLIDSDRQWIKSSVGKLSETVNRNIAFCSHTILNTDALIVEDATLDSRFFDNPFVTQKPGLRFYVGIPLTTSDGFGVGSLCVLDTKPRKLRDDQLKALHVLSKQVMKQMELKKAFGIINKQHEALHDINELNLRLLSIIGHDVRSPLASLYSLLDLRERGLLSREEEIEVFRQLKLTLRTAESLLKDLLQWASSLQNSSTLTLEKLPLKKLLESISQSYQEEFVTKRNKLIVEIQDTLSIHTEKNIVQFALRNLLINANKFTEGGEIIVRAVHTAENIKIHVQDNGVGIEEKRIDGMFDWKNRRSTIGTQGEKGSGLALLLAYDLLKKVGAALEVRSTLGKGSTFSIVLPQP